MTALTSALKDNADMEMLLTAIVSGMAAAFIFTLLGGLHVTLR